jgi:hypothetical protein
MKNFALTTLAVVTLTMFAGDARAQGGFLSNLFGFNTRRPVTNTNYYPTTRPVTNTNYYPASRPATTYPATNCYNGVCTTTQYPPTWNNSGSFGNPTGNGYHNTYPTYYAPGSTNSGNWSNTQPSYNTICPAGYCPPSPATRPTTPYQTTPYLPVNYTAPSYNAPLYNTPTHNNGPYYNSY